MSTQQPTDQPPDQPIDQPTGSPAALPPAYGVRAEWVDLPAHLRRAVEEHLGSPVVEARNQAGGFSPGLAARLRCADGTRAFCKAVGTPQNDGAPGLHRREGQIAAALPVDAPTPRLRFVYDTESDDTESDDAEIDGAEWVALVFDEVDGTMPATPWRAADIDLVIGALDDLADALTPCPVPDAAPARQNLASIAGSWTLLAQAPPDDLEPWEARHLDALASIGAASLDRTDGDTMVHFDVRADNLLITPDRRVVVVDWPHAFVGARWLDVAGFAINIAYYGGDPEAALARSRVFRAAPPEHVTGFLAAVCGMFAERSRQPSPPGLPTVRAFQRAQELAMIPWLASRTGWE